jgi:methylmalonyl-CoA mutase
MNKSLKDPYTNLLRQTTEGMSAILGGVDRLIVQPYDACSIEGKSDFSQRLALNISNLLNDESFLNAVCDPLGGSYAIEDLTKTLTEKAWDLFKKLDKMESMEMNNYLKNSIEFKVQQRIKLLKEGEKLLIGVNKFLNPQPHNMEWSARSTFMNMSYVRLETEVQ